MDSDMLFRGEWIAHIEFDPLIGLLMKFSPWFKQHGMNLARQRAVWARDRHLPIHTLLMQHAATAPRELRQILRDVEEMSTEDAADIIIELAPQFGWDLGLAPLRRGWTCQDIAARAYIERRELFERAMATQTVRDTEDWVDFLDPKRGDLDGRVTEAVIEELEAHLSDHWQKRHRGKFAEVEMHDVDGSPTFFLYHGDLTKSQTLIREKGLRSTREYVRSRAQRLALVRFHKETHRLSVRTQYAPDIVGIKRAFGCVFWDDPERYKVCPLYTCEPLIKYGAAVLRHPSEHLFTVRVKEATFLDPSRKGHVIILRGANGGSVLDADLNALASRGFTQAKSAELGFLFTGERFQLPVALKAGNRIRMRYRLGHTDEIFRYLILKTFLRLPPGGRIP